MTPRTRHMKPPAVSPRRPGVVWPVAVDPAGVRGPTRAQARGPMWVRATQGRYLPAGLDPALATDQRVVTAAALLPPGGAVTGWAALRWAGARYLDGTRDRRPLPVPLAVPPRTIGPRDGIAVTTESHLREHLVVADGITLTSHVAATAFAARHAQSLVEAVGVIDRSAAADLASLDELRAHAARLSGARWVTRLLTAVDLADENSWSPPETLMRLWWRGLGINRVLCNRPLFDRQGTFLGTPDLLDVECGVVGEYDGAHHLDGSQRVRDIRREAALRRAGLEYVEMVAGDLTDPSDFCRRTLEARQRARAARAGARRWTTTLPPGWVPTHTVELRRALSPAERQRLLGWQRGRRRDR